MARSPSYTQGLTPMFLSGLLQRWQPLQFFHRRRWRPVQLTALFGVCLAFVVACGGGSPEADTEPDATAAAGGRVTMGTTLSARTLDPADAYEIFPGILLHNLGDQLYAYEPGTTELIPQLAAELPTVSDDGLTYTIPLREDVTFHNGTPFNAEAMVFSIQRFMENGGRPAFLLSEKIDTVAATGTMS
jgi:peptide/nickel transport system substrate-binding protein